MKPESILETIIYADDLGRAAWFYHDVLGLDMPREMSDLAVLFRVDDRHVLLVFDPSVSDQPARLVPSHGARGPGHIALRIRPDEYRDWLDRFSRFGIPIEQEQDWDRADSGRSIYVRDPAGNSVELITADIWR